MLHLGSDDASVAVHGELDTPGLDLLWRKRVVVRSPPFRDQLSTRPTGRQQINPREYFEQQRRTRDEQQAPSRRFPAQPRRDVLLFLLENAPLERWQQNLLALVRDEAC
jgi:spore cortex formation protein SpoVR/YcgB (stage V sporulation)